MVRRRGSEVGKITKKCRTGNGNIYGILCCR